MDRGPRVLIVDDDTAFCRIAELRLRSWRPTAAISVVSSLADANATLNAEPKAFDLVILDQHLPDGYGWTLLPHPQLKHTAVLAMSADDSPDLPAATLRAGAQHFLSKRQISEALFMPLLDALLERKQLEGQLLAARLRESRLETIRTLISTLRHEINNPLGAVLGGAYLIRSKGQLGDSQNQALALIETSSQRIKQVLERLCEAAELETVTKAHEQVFHVPGDKPWNDDASDAKTAGEGTEAKKRS